MPLIADHNAISDIIATANASIAPNGWVTNDVKNEPFAACANAVVQPHVAQGYPPVAVTKPHSGRPICLCVPMPSSLGDKIEASNSGLAHASASSNAPIRRFTPGPSSIA